MGLYYTPQPPHIGSAQPLEGKKLTPPAGPVPQNPPFNGGSRINPAILGCWAAVAVAAAILPTLPRNLTPPSAPVASVPAPRNNFDIYRAWDPPAPAAIVARNVTPPTGPPPFGVIFDASSAAVITGSGATSFTDSTQMTVGSLANRALIVELCLSGAPTAASVTWNGVAMTQLASSTDAGPNVTTQLYGLRNPASGTQTLAGSWTGAASFVVSAVSFSNVDQASDATAFQNATTATGAASPASVTVPSMAGDKVVAAHSVTLASFTTANNIQLFKGLVGSFAGAGNYGFGAPSTVMSASFATTSHTWTSAGVSVHAVFVPPKVWAQAEVLSNWAPAIPAPIVGPKLLPQPAVTAFPFRGSVVPTEVLAAWAPAPFFQIVQELLIPPIAGPVAQNPPFMGGSEVAQAILNAWIPPPPAPIVAVNLDPPIPGSTPQNPPFAGGAEIPQAVLNAWIPPPPAPIVAVNLNPPIAGPVASNPPFNGGAAVPLAVQIAWLPLPVTPIVAQNLTPPSGPVATFTPPARLSPEILASWQVGTPAPIVARNLTPPSGPVTTFLPLGSLVPREVLISWIPATPTPVVARNLNPPISGPTPDNPPFIGALVPVSSPDEWTPIVARNLTPPSAPVVAFTPIGARVPIEILTAWAPVAPVAIVAKNLTPPSGPAPYVPIGARVSAEILNSWQVAPFAIVTAQNLTPPSGPTAPPPRGSFVPPEVLICWLPSPPAPIVAINMSPPISGPTADNPPFIGALVPISLPEDWAPVVARNLTPPSAPLSVPLGGGARVPGEVLINWLAPAPAPILARNLTPPSGPAADNPPFMGGASLRLEIQLSWQAAQPGYPPLRAVNTTPPSGPPPVVSAEIHAKPFFVSFGLRPL